MRLTDPLNYEDLLDNPRPIIGDRRPFVLWLVALGLLFTLAYALFQLGVEIHLAKITTNVDQVLDVFYVTDSKGAKITTPDSLAKALRTQIVHTDGGT